MNRGSSDTNRLIRHTVPCIGILFIAAISLFYWASSAYAQESNPRFGWLDSCTLETTGSEAVIEFVYAPCLSWEDISEETAPTLYRLAGVSGVGNLVTDTAQDLDYLCMDERVRFHALDDATQTVESVDEAIAAIVDKMGSCDVLIVVSSESFSDSGKVGGSYTPVLMYGAGYDGILVSSTTQRQGIVTAGDITCVVNNLTGIAEQNSGFSVTGAAGTENLDAGKRIEELRYTTAVSDSVDVTKAIVDIGFLIFVIATFALSAALLFLEIDLHPSAMKVLIPITRIAWIFVIAFPVSTYLMFLTLPGVPDAFEAVLSCVLWTVGLAFVALLFGYRTRWVYSLIFLFLLTVLVLFVDQLLGGPLTPTGYLSYEPNEGVRYFGIGNEGSALLFGSWLTLCGILLNRFPTARFVRPFKRWGFLLASLVIIAVMVAPCFGASFGVLVWGVIGVFIAWQLLNERPITLRFVLITTLGTAVSTLSILYLDAVLNAQSHMQWAFPAMGEGFFAAAQVIAAAIAEMSWATITFSPLLTALFFVFVAFLIVLRVVQPGSYKEFWARNVAFRATFTAGLVIIAIMCVLEDSGIFMPTLYLIYPLAGFVWLVCDLHRWRIRELIKNKVYVSIRMLQRRNMPQVDRAAPEDQGNAGKT